jgi:hypothetical protein
VENVILLYFAVTGETLRGFVDSLRSPAFAGELFSFIETENFQNVSINQLFSQIGV